MTAPLLEPPVRYWACPSCGLQDRTQQAGPHTQYHPCPALRGFNAPLVEVLNPGDRPGARHRLVEREDYAGDPAIGRYAALRTERPDGSNDVTVFAPTATAGTRGHNANQ